MALIVISLQGAMDWTDTSGHQYGDVGRIPEYWSRLIG